MNHRLAAAALLTIAALAGCAAPPAAPGKRALMIVGNDEKQTWNDAGAGVMSAHGRDTVSVVDIGTDPLAPKIVVNLPLANTIFGPPTNLAITPDEGLALVANSMNIVDEAGVLQVGARQPAVGHRPDGEPAAADRHGHGRQAAVGHVDQPRRQRWR